MFATCNVPGSPHFKYFHGPWYKCTTWLNHLKRTQPEEVWAGGQTVSLKESKTWVYPDGSPVFTRNIKKGAGRPRNKRPKRVHTIYMSDDLKAWVLTHKDTLENLLIDDSADALDLFEQIETFYCGG